MNTGIETYIEPTETIDCENEAVMAFAKKHAGRSSNPTDQAVSLYYAVRDGIRYDPYALNLSVEGLRASTTLNTGRGWCVAKAILYAACCRTHKIPARLGFADIRNHLSTRRMREAMKTDIFFWHGYTSVYLNGLCIKATQAFNIELCEKFQIKSLDFDGYEDSIYHPFDLIGNKHMEYLRYRGEFADVPIDRIIETFQREYSADESFAESDFDSDVEQENV